MSPLPPPERADVVVVGGGVIGLACAWRLSRHGLSVVVADPTPGRGASWAAAGMLAPATEAHFGEEPLVALNLESAHMWDSFAADLESASGTSIGFRRCGTLSVAFDGGDSDRAEQIYRFQQELGLDVQWLTARQARSLEPDLSPNIRSAVWAPGDHQVHNRRLVDALLSAAVQAGATVALEKVEQVELAGGAADGVVLQSGHVVSCKSVVLAAGCWTGEIGGLPPGAGLPRGRPVKGQILRMSHRQGGPSLSRAVRALVEGQSTYMVPRLDGTMVIGATVEEKGFDTTVTADALYQMLHDARRAVPSTSELVLDEAMAGLRPAYADNAPIVGAHPGVPGLVVASGHYRNGILLTPVTVEAVAAMVMGGEPPAAIKAFGPDRFSQVKC